MVLFHILCVGVFPHMVTGLSWDNHMEQTKTDDLRSKAESGAPPLPDYVLKFEKGNKRKRGEESEHDDDDDDDESDDPAPEDDEYEIQAGCIDSKTDPNCFEIFWR